MMQKLESLIFDHRRPILLIFGALTILFAWSLSQLRIDAGFEKSLPLDHPYMETFREYQEEFGGANRLLISVRSKDGDIFQPEFFEALKSVTDSVFFLPGVNRATVNSLFTPNVRFIEIVEGGFSGGNVVPADFSPTPEMLARVHANVLKSGQVGRLVANDFSAAMVSAQLSEIDPATGEKLDYLEVARLLEEKIRDPHISDQVDIHIIGFAKVMGDIADGATGVVLFFLIALLITAVLVRLFTKSFRLAALPLICSMVAVIWNLGLLPLLGYGLDPMSLLVPFLTFAIGVSHGVQMVNAVRTGLAAGLDAEKAARRAFRRLLVPGGVALLSDTIGFLTILLIGIRMIRELAITASLGVAVILLTNLILLPLLLSRLNYSPEQSQRLRRSEGAGRWAILGGFTRWPQAIATIVVALALAAGGWVLSQDLPIGDLHAGVPELRQESRYNRDTANITESYSIGVDILTTIVETVPDGCTEHDVMDLIDRFSWELANVEGVQSTISLAQVGKIINAGWNEGHLAWRTLPRDPSVLAQAIGSIETSTGLLNSDCSVMPVMAFLEDHRAETLQRVTAAVEAFGAEHNDEKHRFRLATGNAGVMAATNEVVKDAQVGMLAWIYLAVMLLCLLSFRSWRAALCIILPLTLVSTLCYALMSVLGIGLKTSTLPVAALGVGVGVDYGIYIYSRLKSALAEGLPLEAAYLSALRETGNAVVFTGLTLAAGVGTWIFSDLKFQADMGILLTFLFVANMLGAILILPALARVLLPKA